MLAATPLGNPQDASAHLCQLLTMADVIAAEDTRRTQRLARDLNITTTGRFISFYEAVEAERIDGLLTAAQDGQLVLVVTDAGMPAVSDPGFRLVEQARERGIPLTVAPGPSAVTTALVLSGLPTDRFTFEGFLPRKAGARDRVLTELATQRRTMVFFESPRRTADTVAAMAAAFGSERPAALCRELTKTYEEVVTGTLADLQQRVSAEVLGEVTIVVGGADEPPVMDLDEAVAEVHAKVEAGLDRKQALAEVVATSGIRRRELYNAFEQSRRNPESRT